MKRHNFLCQSDRVLKYLFDSMVNRKQNVRGFASKSGNTNENGYNTFYF